MELMTLEEQRKHFQMLKDMLAYNEKKGSKKTVNQLKDEISQFLTDYPDMLPTTNDWFSAYLEDLKRGKGGGGSEQEANPGGNKQKMKDNVSDSIRLTREQKELIKEETRKFEEENGIKLERLSRFSMSRSKIDSYTGEPIE